MYTWMLDFYYRKFRKDLMEDDLMTVFQVLVTFAKDTGFWNVPDDVFTLAAAKAIVKISNNR